uniref:Uncharacterized protein n=1 Tax=Ananas comosus var. bracteatus TaxID=296719 RepID=A0A6V7NGD4_ANACO|nr:unnamed protein product [Ananas comosus var. bracteatus]
MVSVLLIAHQASNVSAAVPAWLNEGDNTWQMVSATLVGLQGFPGLALLYAGLARPNWGLNSAFMPLNALAAAAAPCWSSGPTTWPSAPASSPSWAGPVRH